MRAGWVAPAPETEGSLVLPAITAQAFRAATSSMLMQAVVDENNKKTWTVQSNLLAPYYTLLPYHCTTQYHPYLPQHRDLLPYARDDTPA